VLFGSKTKRVINFDAEPNVMTVPIQNEDELYKITEISSILDMNEKVLLVITQSKVRLVGLPFNSYVIYATDKRIIIRDISLHGLKEDTIEIPYSIITDINHKEGFISSCIRLKLNRIQGDVEMPGLNQDGTIGNEWEWIIEHIPKSKATLLDKIVRAKLSKSESLANEHQSGTGANERIIAPLSRLESPVDELFKIARLKSEGVINEQEFTRLKQNIIEHTH
jgi:hypothetical protein